MACRCVSLIAICQAVCAAPQPIDTVTSYIHVMGEGCYWEKREDGGGKGVSKRGWKGVSKVSLRFVQCTVYNKLRMTMDVSHHMTSSDSNKDS